jgi:hypothetical protein
MIDGEWRSPKCDDQARLHVSVDDGLPIDPTEPTEHTVGITAAALPVLATPGGFRVQVPEAGGYVYVRALAGVTTSGAGRGWEIPPGTARRFNWSTTAGVYAIASASTEILVEVEQ